MQIFRASSRTWDGNTGLGLDVSSAEGLCRKSKPDSCVITYPLQVKVFKHSLSLMKNVPGKTPKDSLTVIKSQEGLTHPLAAAEPQLGSLGRRGRAAAFAGLSSTRPLCLCQRAEIHPTCSFVQVLAKWLLGDSLPLLLTLSFWQGARQRDDMPGEASALHFPLPPFPLQKSVWSLIQMHPGWDNSCTVRN